MFLLSETSRLALVPTLPSVECLPGVKRPWREIDQFDLVPRLRMSRAVPLLRQVPSWHGQGLYLLTYCLLLFLTFYNIIHYNATDYLIQWNFFGRVRKNCEKRLLASSCLSVPPSVRMDGFLWNLIFQYFSKMCGGSSTFIKIWEE